MTRYPISFLISRILFSKILRFTSIIKKHNSENNFFFFFIKKKRSFLRKLFLFKTVFLYRFLEKNKIYTNFFKFLLNYNFLKKCNLVEKNFHNLKLYYFLKKKILSPIEIFFQSCKRLFRKRVLISNLILNVPFKLNEKIRKVPYLRIMLSGINSTLKKKIEKGGTLIISLVSEDPVFFQNCFFQEMVWNYFRIKYLNKRSKDFMIEPRMVAFLNNSLRSFFFFSFFFQFYGISHLYSLVNFCFKNIKSFIVNKNGHLLILYLMKKVYFSKNKWFNFRFLEKLLYKKIFYFYHGKILIKFLFRETSRTFRKNPAYNMKFELKRRMNKKPFIIEIIKKQKSRIVFFIKFLKSEFFEISSLNHRNFSYNEFTMFIRTTIKFKMPIKNKISLSSLNWCHESIYGIKKNFFFSSIVKIKNCQVKFQFTFYIMKNILNFLFMSANENRLKDRNSLNLYKRSLPFPIRLKLNLRNILGAYIRIADNILIYFYKQFKLLESC